ncbi:superoxide dismutase [Kitasatospora sp. MMS16-BH015]|uniref:superoxide dismutase n=1 Tax=Kitasatospora sp. MMS16-BH015 TaxID=2018025 RepID=UPI000CA23BA3|nr:superoxide dismutase [Kitasatospora sp. MMS16-BH015]AUG77244.1 superoxide dismutase [Kitasatospora sp. MMS16-BH015]
MALPLSVPAALLPLALLPSLAAPATTVDAVFEPASAFLPATAISYAQDLVPYGSRVHVRVVRVDGHTAVALQLSGVAPGRVFPVHAHTGRCGAAPADSGPHYQDQADPVQPSTDPAYANGSNEVRLAVSTDAQGTGSADTTVAWTFRDGGAHSLVLHAGTPSGDHAAADRVACVNVGF